MTLTPQNIDLNSFHDDWNARWQSEDIQEHDFDGPWESWMDQEAQNRPSWLMQWKEETWLKVLNRGLLKWMHQSMKALQQESLVLNRWDALLKYLALQEHQNDEASDGTQKELKQWFIHWMSNEKIPEKIRSSALERMYQWRLKASLASLRNQEDQEDFWDGFADQWKELIPMMKHSETGSFDWFLDRLEAPWWMSFEKWAPQEKEVWLKMAKKESHLSEWMKRQSLKNEAWKQDINPGVQGLNEWLVVLDGLSMELRKRWIHWMGQECLKTKSQQNIAVKIMPRSLNGKTLYLLDALGFPFDGMEKMISRASQKPSQSQAWEAWVVMMKEKKGFQSNVTLQWHEEWDSGFHVISETLKIEKALQACNPEQNPEKFEESLMLLKKCKTNLEAMANQLKRHQSELLKLLGEKDLRAWLDMMSMTVEDLETKKFQEYKFKKWKTKHEIIISAKEACMLRVIDEVHAHKTVSVSDALCRVLDWEPKDWEDLIPKIKKIGWMDWVNQTFSRASIQKEISPVIMKWKASFEAAQINMALSESMQSLGMNEEVEDKDEVAVAKRPLRI